VEKKKQNAEVLIMDKRLTEKTPAAGAAATTEATPVIASVMRLEGFGNVASGAAVAPSALHDTKDGAMQTTPEKAKQKQHIHISLDELPPPAFF
jgi:hypothetical protein